MKTTLELNKRQRVSAIKHAKLLLGLLKSVTEGTTTVDDHKFSASMKKLRDELQGWGFYGEY
jgi:hypothetical protein